MIAKSRKVDSFWVALFLALVLSLAASRAMAAGGGLFGWALGNILAIVHALAGEWIHRRALSKHSTVFFAWALLGNLTRLGILLTMLAVAMKVGVPEIMPLVAAVLTGYFVFLGREILRLHLADLPLNIPSSPAAFVE